jgi:hypothetical protein
MVDMATTATTEFTFSALVQQPTRVAAAVEERGRVILHRRNAPDLLLSQVGELPALAAFARLLGAVLARLPEEEIPAVVVDGFPWTRYLKAAGRTEFARTVAGVVSDCVELGTFAPLEIFLAEWRDTAATQADAELVERRLTKPLFTSPGEQSAGLNQIRDTTKAVIWVLETDPTGTFGAADVRGILEAEGWRDRKGNLQTMEGISVTMADLARVGRIRRVDRGVYQARQRRQGAR